MKRLTSVVQTMHTMLGYVRREMADLRAVQEAIRGQVDSLLLQTDIESLGRTGNAQQMTGKV